MNHVPRVASAADTRSTISCGKYRCVTPAQGCQYNDLEGSWACVTKDEDTFGEAMLCDDGLDCPQGETCCSQWNFSTSSSQCTPRSQVASECRSELCEPNGAKCPPGETCLVRAAGEGGTCEAHKGPATCANEKRCPSDKSVCAIAPQALMCVSVDSLEYKTTNGDKRFECTKQSDCSGGEICSVHFGETEPELATFCSKWKGAFMSHRVCDPRKRIPGCQPAQHTQLPWLGLMLPR